MLLDPAAPLSDEFRHALSATISSFISSTTPLLTSMGPELALTARLAADFTQGGKRLRPAFCAWGYRAIADEPVDPTPLLLAAASLDLLHVSALIHDDVMDASDTRRGIPAAHRQYELSFSDRNDADILGRNGAILLGDLILMLSAEMFDLSGFSPEILAAARPLLATMRTEVTCGQILDITAQTSSPGAPDAVAQATRVLEYKSARYTVVRPTQIGAALAGANPATIATLGSFGSPIGRAFQLRDDLLGVFGDETITGKPAGDDLREGKRTILVARAFATATPAQRTTLETLFGNPDLDSDGIATLCEILTDTGAVIHVERQIEDGLTEALEILDTAPLTSAGREGLHKLAIAAVRRDA
ncbi:MAG: polyprenyl synthetase family protein [Propionibacteriaceae bacterium]